MHDIKGELFLENGLVKDPDHYKHPPESRVYVVAYYDNMDCFFTDILSKDFDTLRDNNWLSDVAVDIILAILDPNSQFQRVGTHLSRIIFNENTHTHSFISSLIFKKDKLAFPVLVNSNHWCLAIVNTNTKEFQFIDPRGSTERTTVSYMNKFLSYIEKYNNVHAHTPIQHNNWKPIISTHILQRDSHNCGAYAYCIFFNKF